MTWRGRNWDEIPTITWEDPVLHIHKDGTFGIEFDYIGFNGHRYHFPEKEVDFGEWLDIYDELKALHIEFEVEYDP